MSLVHLIFRVAVGAGMLSLALLNGASVPAWADGDITEFQLDSNSRPYGVALGADGAVWFTEGPTNRIGRIATDGGISEFAVPTPLSLPAYITSGQAHDLWFTEEFANKVARITTDGEITEFPIPSADSHPRGIATGSNGNFWFAESATNQIGRLTPHGDFSEFLIPTADSPPRSPAAPMVRSGSPKTSRARSAA